MRLFQKENKVRELMEDHMETVTKAVDSWKEAFLSYIKGDRKNFEDKADATIELETKADEVRRQTQLLLYGGAHLPIFREDLLDLLELIENIADDAERGVNVLQIEHPEILPSWHENFTIIVEESHRAFGFFKEAFTMLHEKRSDVLPSAHKVQEAEKKVDKLQNRLMAKIFQSNLALAHKLQLRELILTIGYVSDSSENASDKVGLIAIKGRI